MYDREAMRIGIQQFWGARREARNRQSGGNDPDRGNRRAVTSGTHLDGILDALIAMIAADGVVDEAQVIRRRRVAVLPGYYRPEKEWDLIFRSGERLAAVVELKAQVGPSFGNNFNNRAEEALGSAEDLWTAYREGAFGDQPAPWLGYLFILEEHPASTRPVQVREPLYSVFPEFANTSYAQRYELLLRRMVRERRYNAAALLLSKDPGGSQASFAEPADDLSPAAWVRSLSAHLSAFA